MIRDINKLLYETTMKGVINVEINIKIKLTDEEFKNLMVTDTLEEELNIDEILSTSKYARYFDESCSTWDKDPHQNLIFLKTQQSYANDLLKMRGYLFLNEVYHMLGLPKTKDGEVVGWIHDVDDALSLDDGFVDFGIFSKLNEDFVKGKRNSTLLDFNVDGNILNEIGEL